MKRDFKPYKLSVSIQVEVDLNELLDGLKLHTTIAEIKKNIGMYLRAGVKQYKFVPGEDITIPDEGQIAGNLHEWDIVSYGEE
ncbi:hypothetical protein JYT85_01440 [Desulfocapsa sp. AH-315-G09]|uniref:Phage protein n=1 Tax=Desulfotalea psychrophila TaxID=84980 RepID=A0ABS3ATK1_9BACT|nr:hypothetical protein [Desulfocapsa sp.]MBN4065291.1 hypothetical protein [Desulfocapsa sp. AH-315-G09]MBN4068421.1 hypothetical protein [Desulfotalea psychrophila]